MEQLRPHQPDHHASCGVPPTLLFRGATVAEPHPLYRHIRYGGVLHDASCGRPSRFVPAAPDDASTRHCSDESWGEDDWLNHYSEEDEDYEDEVEGGDEEDDFLYDDEEDDWIDDPEYAYDEEAFIPDEESAEEEPEEEEDDSYLYYGDDAYDED